MASQYQKWQEKYQKAVSSGNEQAIRALKYIEPYMNTWDSDLSRQGFDYLNDNDRTLQGMLDKLATPQSKEGE